MILDRLLDHVGVSIEPFAVCRVNRGWSLEMAAPHEIHLHFVVAGTGKVLAGTYEAPIAPRTLVVVPAGMNHRIEPEHAGQTVGLAQAACTLDELGLNEYTIGDDQAVGILMTCGRLQVTHEVTGTGLFDSLHQPLVIDLNNAGHLFDSMLAEQREPRPGGRRMMELLMEQVLIHLFRGMCQDSSALPWLTALQDDRFARVLDAIFDDPAKRHTLDSLAQLAGMSRSSFSEAFNAAFGRSAVELVKEVRLERAAKLLKSSDLAVKEVASKVGFSSRSHFSRAFKERYGIDPAGYRS